MRSALRVLAAGSLVPLIVLVILPVLHAPLAAAPPGRSGEEVERSPGDGRIQALRGALTPPSPEGPREIAERFLSGQAARFGMKPGHPDLRLARVVESPAGRHFLYEQTSPPTGGSSWRATTTRRGSICRSPPPAFLPQPQQARSTIFSGPRASSSTSEGARGRSAARL